MNTIITNTILSKDEYEDLCNRFSKDLVDREIQLEYDTKEESYSNYLNKLNKEEVSTMDALKGTVIQVIKGSLNAYALQIQAFYNEANTGKPGKRHQLVAVLNQLSVKGTPDIFNRIGYLTLRTVMNAAMKKANILLATLAAKLGREVELELRYLRVSNSLPTGYRIYLVGKTLGYDRGHTERFWKLREAYQKNIGDIEDWESWDSQKKTGIGLKLIELLVVSTGLGRIEKIKQIKNKQYTIQYFFSLSSELVAYMKANDEDLADLAFEYHPMLIPPMDWSEPLKGGYLINLRRPIPFIKKLNKVTLNTYKDVDMPKVYKAVNVIQSTAWQINTRVLDVALEIAEWENIPDNLDVPSKVPSPKPYMEPGIENDKEAFRAWKDKAIAWHRGEIIRKTKRLLVNALISEAVKFRREAAIYFPYNIDFRGRIYPLPRFSPQGNDFCKSLLKFAEGKPIGHQGRMWLAFHGANCYGLDKATLEDRLSWTYENTELILSIAKDPLENRQWMDTDSPWEFLAFCFEWEGVMREGENYVCSLPVAFDGSCSGLQHYSAMLRDEIGGSAVNLVPSNEVQDIYKRVAIKVNEYLKVDADDGTQDEIKTDEEGNEHMIKGSMSLAREWLKFGVNRTVCKRPTMTLCYGASKYGFSDQVYDDTVSEAVRHDALAFSYPRQSAKYLADLIWRALGEVVVKAKEAMGWLQIASGLLASDRDLQGNSIPTYWVTPAGFPVYQQYRKEQVKRVKTILNNTLVIYDPLGKTETIKKGTPMAPSIKIELKDLDPRRQKNGIAPNFVHSMDACHMMLTVLSAHEKGINSFACIHDSFGTLPSDAQVLYTTIREVFCSIYENHDVLKDLHDQVALMLSQKQLEKLPEVPSRGQLDIEKVKQSLYAFS